MKKKVIVLGAGLVGSVMAIDLSKKWDVTVADRDTVVLNSLHEKYEISTTIADFSDVAAIKKIVADFDLVVGAVPGFLGFRIMKAVIEAGKNMVDIAFFPEDAFELDALAKKHKVTAVVDCGVAPGMSNMVLGYHAEQMEVQNYTCYVGGLPVVREWPYEYRAVFSPIDVIEEYIRPARYVQNSHLVVREALSDPELINFKGVGTLEAWNSDGLRTLIKSYPKVPNMIEKTLRYPGTIEYLRVLRASGFFSYEEVEINGAKIRPVDMTAKLLFPKWKLKEGEEDFTIMRMIVEGTESGHKVSYQYDLLDRFDRENQIISMARTTGYTCTAVADLVLSGRFAHEGICPPELVSQNPDNFADILEYLAERDVIYRVEKKEIH